MPNFTEGEWNTTELDGMFMVQANHYTTVASYIRNESDAHLMAQSKKMYEAMARMLEDFDKWGTRDMGEDNFEEVRAILYEIDKE